MKNQLSRLLIALALCASLQQATAQGTAFTYQGRLDNGTNPVTGNYDLTFALFNAASGGVQVGSTITNLSVGVTNGLFTVIQNFGAVFNGTAYWLEIGVRTNSSAAGPTTFTTLSPLQELTPTPYSITAENVTGAIRLAQLPPMVVTNDETGVTLSNVTVQGDLNLPSPAAIYSGGSSVFYGDTNFNFFAGLDAGNLPVSGADNTALGSSALESITSGSQNTGTGAKALQANTTGSINTGTGEQALWYNTTGIWNTATGVAALPFNTNGSYNTADGVNALLENSSGNDNTADGVSALRNNITGGNNVALGYQAGENITGSSNIDIGHPGVSSDNMVIRLGNGQTATYIAGVIYGNGAGLTNVAGNSLLDSPGGQNFFAGPSAGNPASPGTYNTAVGFSALNVNTASYNSALGNEALSANTTGGANTADGVFTLWQNTTGGNNTALGADAMAYNISGSFNTAVGQFALADNTTGSYNVAVGTQAMVNSTHETGIVAIGYQALENDAAVGGYIVSGANTAIGYQALQLDNTGAANTAIGYRALNQNTSGYNNVANGDFALEFNTTGDDNTANGSGALGANTTGIENTANGVNALFSNTSGYNNAANGYQALYGNTTGFHNTAAGGSSLQNNLDGSGNVADGYEALYSHASGNNNVAVGAGALQTPSTDSGDTAVGGFALQNLTSGANNIAIGINAGNKLFAGADNIYLGNVGSVVENGIIRIGTPGTHAMTYIAGTIEDPICNNLTITGGADLAEPFDITPAEEQVSEGAVVIIDGAHPGQLKLADRPYDTRVAGVISGANGIHPGIQMQQQGLLEGGRNVALTGRVYVQADTSNGVIEPGDLLTTSSTPGRAMKVTDHVRAQGAILGKAMSGLSKGKGMVLLLVTLQ